MAAPQMAVIGHSGHFPMNDNPEAFYPRLKAFLNTA
jgi:acyl transferase domain-containing protein